MAHFHSLFQHVEINFLWKISNSPKFFKAHWRIRNLWVFLHWLNYDVVLIWFLFRLPYIQRKYTHIAGRVQFHSFWDSSPYPQSWTSIIIVFPQFFNWYDVCFLHLIVCQELLSEMTSKLLILYSFFPIGNWVACNIDFVFSEYLSFFHFLEFIHFLHDFYQIIWPFRELTLCTLFFRKRITKLYILYLFRP